MAELTSCFAAGVTYQNLAFMDSFEGVTVRSRSPTQCVVCVGEGGCCEPLRVHPFVVSLCEQHHPPPAVD